MNILNYNEVITLTNFILRTRMYITSESRISITSFICGFEIGSNSNYRISELIENHLEKNYELKKSSSGWPDQLNAYAKKKKLRFSIAFKKILIEIISGDLKGRAKSQFYELIKTKLKNMINKLKEGFEINQFWADDWSFLVDIRKAWFKNLWSDEILQVFERLDNELKTPFQGKTVKLSEHNSKMLIKLKNEFNNRIE